MNKEEFLKMAAAKYEEIQANLGTKGTDRRKKKDKEHLR